jgi:hypothetical protein
MTAKKQTLKLFISDIFLEVTGYYCPEEPTEWYDDNMSGHPGYAADFEIESVKVEGIDILAIISSEVYDEIIKKSIEQQS